MVIHRFLCSCQNFHSTVLSTAVRTLHKSFPCRDLDRYYLQHFVLYRIRLGITVAVSSSQCVLESIQCILDYRRQQIHVRKRGIQLTVQRSAKRRWGSIFDSPTSLVSMGLEATKSAKERPVRTFWHGIYCRGYRYNSNVVLE